MDPTEEELYEKTDVELVPVSPEKARAILAAFAELLVSAWLEARTRPSGADDTALPGG